MTESIVDYAGLMGILGHNEVREILGRQPALTGSFMGLRYVDTTFPGPEPIRCATCGALARRAVRDGLHVDRCHYCLDRNWIYEHQPRRSR